MSKSLLRAALFGAALIAGLPGAAFAASVDLNIYSMSGSPDPITLGTGNVTYTVSVNNSSSTTGTNLVLTNTLPASSTYASSTATSSGSCSQSAGTVTCSWPSIAAGSFYSATIVVTPAAGGALTLSSSVSGTEPDPNTLNNSASKAVIVNSQIDLGISSMTVSPDPITLGTGDVQFLVQFTNNSTSQATNAVLTSTIPASSTFVSATTPVGAGSCSQSAGTVTCNWATIGAGSTYYAYITVTPTTGGVLTLSSSVSATQSDSNTSNNSGSKAVTVNSQIDLGMSSMTVSPDPMTLGTGNVQYLVQFNNGSTSQATNVVLTSTLPASSTFVSATTPVGSGTCSQSPGTVTCNWATMGPGSTYYAYITVTPTAAGSLSLTSTVSAAQSDPNTANNSGSKAVTVNSQIDLGLSSMTVSPDPITLGTGDVQFLVQFTNHSTSQATNAVLTSTIPANSTFVSATTPVGSGSCSQSAGTVTCNWASIGPGSTYYAYITVTPTAGGVLTLSSSVSATQSDPDASNNSGSKAVTVNSQIDLGFTSMTVSPDPMTLGTGDVQFLVQFNNGSTSQSTNVVLTSTLPSNSTFVSATTPVGSGSCSQSAGTVTCNWSTIGAGSNYYAYITVTPTAAGSLTLTSSVSAAQSDPNTSNNTASKAGTVNSDIDLSISSISGSPDPITLGSGNVLYTVYVYNGSGSQGTNVVLTSTLPSGATFVSATTPIGSGTCSQSGGTVTCNWASIGAGSTYYAYITVTPTANGVMTLSSSVSGAQTDPNTINNSASKGVTVGTAGAGVDLQLYNISGTPDPITLNTGNVTYTVQVYNSSSTGGTSTVLTNTLPANSTYVSSSATNSGNCSQSGGTVTCTWASIPAFNSYYATIVVTPTAGGPLALAASVAGAEADPNAANNSSNKSVTVNSKIDLQLYNISGTPDPVTLNNGNVTYTIQVYNASSSQGTNIVLTNTLPSNSTYVSSTASNSGTCGPSSGTLVCNWTSIGASSSYFATIVVTPTAGGPLTLTASVAGTESDSNTSNNSASKSTTVNSQIDLQVYNVSGTPDPITLGTGNVTYTVQVYNASTSQGTNAVLTAALPSNSTYVSSSASNSGTCSQSPGTVTCNWTSIGASNSYFATIIVTPTAGGPLTLTASVAGTESDSNTANNSGSKSVTVNSQIDLQLYNVTATPDPITLNTGNVTYTVQVYNASTTQGTNTVLTAALPSNSTYVSSSASNSGTCSQSAGSVTCNWTSIGASNSYFATIIVTPTAGGPLTLTASVAGTESDSNTSNNSGSKSVTVNSQIDLQIYSMSSTPDPITLNTGNVTYTVNVFNASTSQGTNTILTNTLPSNSTYVSSSASNSGTCTHAGSTVTCNWTSIPASGFYSATIVVTPTSGGTMTLSSSVTGTEPDSNTANNSGTRSVTVNAQIDLQVYSIGATPDPMTLNTGNVTYTVNVYNTSSSQGTNTVLTSTLPTNSMFVSASATNSGTCTQSAGTVTCNWTSIPASGFYTATIIVTPTAGGPLALSASVSGTESDSNTANNSGNKAATVNDQIDLRVYSISGSPDPITFGAGNVTFSSNIYNQSTSQGTNVVLTNTLPSNSTYVSSSANGGGTCSHSGSTVTCTWAAVPASSFYTATIVVTPTTPGTLTLSASVAGAQTDPNTTDNSGSATTTVTPTSCTAVPSGAVAWYRAENNGVDSIGPNFATANGGAAYTTGKAGQAFSLNGTTAYVSAPDNASLHQSAFTIEGWFFLTGGTGVRTIVSKTAGASFSDSFVVYIAANGAIAAGYGDTSSIDAFSTSTIPTTNAWHHFAYTYDGATQELYLDGASAGSAAATPAIGYDTHPLLLGADIDNESTVSFFPGRIDEVTMYSRVLSAAEIQNVFGAGTFGKCYVAAPAPTITGFTPGSGSAGTSVVISGTDFTAVSAVKFNGAAATFTGNSSTQITATVPASATTGAISVVTGGGTATSASSFNVPIATHWINSSGGNWNTASNWSTGSVPTASNDVIVDASGTYTVNVDVTPAFNTLTVGGGATGTQTLDLGTGHDVTFTNPGTVTTSGVLTFGSGRLLGAGPLTVNGTMNWMADSEIDTTVNIATGATLNISGSGTRFVNAGTINNSGTVNWSGGNNLSIYNAGIINNLAAGLFSVTNDSLIYQHCCGAGQAFNNAGTFRKTVATSTTTIDGNGFDNSGTLDVQSGTVILGSGGSSTGVFNATSTGAILVSSVYTLGSGATLTGNGNYQLAAGQLDVAAAGVTVNHMTLAGGNLNIDAGGSLSTTSTGVIDWSGDATLSGAGPLNVAVGATLNFSGTGTRYIDGSTLNNSGTINWSGGNNLSVYDSGVINNLAGGLFLVTNDQTIYFHCCAAGQAFNNAGTFRKSTATSTTTFQGIGFANSGTLQPRSGVIAFNSTFTSSGSPAYDFGIGSATTYGRLTFANAVSLTGALTAAPINGFVPQGGQQFQIITFPSGTASFSPKTLTFGSSPVRSFADSYTASAVTLTASGPVITAALSPNSGLSSGGTAVTISGSGFASGASLGVTFGGVAATAVTVVNANTITCTTPAHASGVVDVVLTNGDGQPTTVTNGFTYDTAPVVSAIRPNSGSVAGSGGVIIEGTNLNSVTSVTFGATAGTILSSTATQLVVAAPAHAAGTIDVAVTNAVGTYTVTNGFTYIDNDDVARDFFVSTNPSARWSYGYETSRGAAFTPHSVHGNSSGFDYWGPSLPVLGRNSTTSTLQQASNFTPPMKVLLHPGAAGENSVARWTAPATGQYRVHGYFVGYDSTYPTTSDVAILHNNSTAATLFFTNINSYNVPANFDVTTAFSAGDTVEFTVGFGTNGNYSGDATGLDVTIDPAGAGNADVAISGSAPATVATGSNFTYTTIVTNNGPAAASNVSATITLPANVTLNGSTSSTQGTCSGTNPITCLIGTLPLNGTATQTINLTATGAGTATLAASASATETDSNNSNNSTTSNVGIGGTSTLVVTTNADSGTGSLRQAILDANASLCTAPCTIAFNLPGAQLTILPPASLPALTAAGVTIDGTTQPGYSGTPLITLDGSSNPNPSAGLQLSGGNDGVKGLSIVTFQGSAIVIDGGGSDTVAANYLGIHTDGSTAGQNAGEGVLVTSANNTIGGTTAAARNIISGNFGSGVVIKGVSGNAVRGNYIGLNAAGTTNVANHTDGIQLLNGASFNTIGGTTAAERNVISGNNNSGVYITSSASNCSGNVIAGNYIGTDAAGSASIGNTTGVFLGALVSTTTIGGLTAGAGNTIVSNITGITFDGPGNGVAILGNSITGNSGLTIDLASDGANANDAGDGDVGPNNLQNTPAFVDASLAGGTLTAHVNVDSAAVANTAGIRVELFKSDASGAHALSLLGSQCFAGNALNGVAISVNSAPVVLGDKLVATATSYADGSCSTIADGTSEFSAAATITTCTPPSATITPNGPTTFCTGGSVTLTASAGASYQWRNFATPIVGANAQQYVATTAGSYTVTVTNAAGCSATSSATSVSVNSTVNVTISAGGPTTFCAGGSVNLTANPTGGSGTFASYQWSLNGSPIGGANASTYSATATGNYTVTVNDSAGCTGTSAAQSVTVNAPPSAAINAPASTCANSSVAASILSPAGGATYNWSITNGTLSSGQGTPSITFTAGTSSPISISVTASLNGCSATGNASVAVGAFTPTITGSNTFCPGGNTTLTASAGTSYQWSLNASPLGGANSQTYVATAAGNYTVTVTNGSGCSGTSATFAVSQAALATPTATASGPTTFCSGGSVTLTSSAAANYQWLLNGVPLNGSTSQSFNAIATGSYSVTVTSGSCSATSSPVAITVNPAPSVSITGPGAVCAGGSATLDAGAGFASYSWSDGATTQSITVSPASTTTYSVTVTNNGCSASASKTITITSGATTATILAPSSVPSGSTGNTASVPPAQSGSTYNWTISGGTITSGNGTPSIVWTAGNGGIATISINITSGSCSASGSVNVAINDSADLALTMTATPNPVNTGGTVTFTLNSVNNGPSTAQNVTVINTLSGVSAASASGSGWSCNVNGNSAVCTRASFAVGAGSPITITATATGGTASDDAAIGATTSDPNVNNNSASASVAVGTPVTCNNSAPSLIFPAAGASNLASSVNFTWSAAANATSYDLWIASSGGAPAIATTTQSTSATINLPSGPSTWYVVAHFPNDCPALASSPRDLTVAASANCSTAAPQLIAPAPNANVTSPVTFTWTAVPQAVGYRLWLAIDGGAIQDAATTNGATSVSVPLSGLSVVWHVDAIFPGCAPTSSPSSSFTLAATTGCASHTAPSLLAPAANATLPSSVTDLQWTAAAGANGYRVWASINGAEFAPIATTPPAVTTLHFTFTSGNVAWYVEALFDGCASLAASQQTFTIPPAQNCNNAASTPLSPANNVTLTTGFVEFDWTAVANAIGYELWFSIDGGAPSLAGSTTGTFLRRTVGTGNIEWFVRTLFDRCDAVESAHARFTFTPPADCSVARSILTAPFDGAPVFTPFDLRWSNVPGATQYKVWLASGIDAPKVIGTTSGLHLDNQTAPVGPVSWSVEALFDDCPAVRSTVSTFTALAPPPPCATPAVPLPRAESTASTNVAYAIRWTPVGPKATTQYELQESADADFSAPITVTTDAGERTFTHINSSDAPVTYYYRVRAVGTCNGALSLFSLPVAVQVLPSNVTDPQSANGSTPADNPQTTHYEIHLGGANGASTKSAIAAAAGDTFTATTNQPWLTVSPSSGTVAPEGTTLNVTAKTDGLPVGTSSGAVNVTFGTASGASHGRPAALDYKPLGDKPPATTTVSLNLVQPVSPTSKNGPPPDALIIPAVAHADGINSKFQSDVRVTNSSAQPMKYQVTFTPTGDAGITSGKQTTVDIDPGRTIALDDVLESWFGSNGATGTLEVRPLTTAHTSTSAALPAGLANLLTFASSRTFNTTSNGTFGQYIPAIPFAAFVGRASDPTKSTILSLQQIAQSPAYRTNLGIVEGSGDPASVLISVFGDDGKKLTEFTQDLKGGQHIQLNSVLAQKNVQVNDGRIEVKVTTATGKVTAYASVLDNLTNDPLLVSPVAVNATAASKYVIPGVADLNNGIANWQTDVRLFNPSTNSVKATLTFYSQNGGTPQSKDVLLAPGQVQTFDAALHQFFGLANDGGALHISTTATTPLVATARTYNQTSSGTYGQFIPAVTANDAAALGTRPLQLLQIEESDRYRTNIGFAEVTGKAATVEITAVPSDSKVAASTQINLTPNQFIQYPQLLKSMGLTNMYNARVTVRVISGQGRVTAYASVIDSKTNDPTFVPAQ